MIDESFGLKIQSWFKDKGLGYIKNFFILTIVITILLSTLDTYFGNDKVKQQYNGLIVTDKQGKSYMVRHSMFGMFKINEFDVIKMRLIE